VIPIRSKSDNTTGTECTRCCAAIVPAAVAARADAESEGFSSVRISNRLKRSPFARLFHLSSLLSNLRNILIHEP
jgi:hypothetical protein